MKYTLGAVLGAAAILLLGWFPQHSAEAFPNAPGLEGGADGSIFCVAGGDLQGVNNLLWVVHRRKLNEREKNLIKSFDKSWDDSEEWITVSLFRANPGGPSAGGAPARHVWTMTANYAKMQIGSDTATTRVVEEQRDTVKEWEKQIERNRPKK